MNANPIESGQASDEPALSAREVLDREWPPGYDARGEVDPADCDAAEVAVEAADAAAHAGGPRPLASASDPQLAGWIEAIVDHDERSLAALYDATFSRVFGIVKRIVRRSSLAEEVVEDTYFQVWRQAARFDPARGTAITWLLAVARSRAVDAIRRESRFQHEALDDDDSGALACEAASSDQLLDLARHHAELHRALLLLGAQPRQLVALAFFRGLNHEEIAAQTRLPLGTVKSQIRRALQTLRQFLGKGIVAAPSS